MVAVAWVPGPVRHGAKGTFSLNGSLPHSPVVYPTVPRTIAGVCLLKAPGAGHISLALRPPVTAGNTYYLGAQIPWLLQLADRSQGEVGEVVDTAGIYKRRLRGQFMQGQWLSQHGQHGRHARDTRFVSHQGGCLDRVPGPPTKGSCLPCADAGVQSHHVKQGVHCVIDPSLRLDVRAFHVQERQKIRRPRAFLPRSRYILNTGATIG